MAAEVTKGTFDLRGSSLKEQRGADKGEMPMVANVKERAYYVSISLNHI